MGKSVDGEERSSRMPYRLYRIIALLGIFATVVVMVADFITFFVAFGLLILFGILGVYANWSERRE